MQSKAIRYVLYGLVALAAFGVGAWFNRPQEAPSPTGSDAIMAISLPDLQNTVQGLKQWQGKVLVVNFWATWCAPCREEIPMFVKLQQKYAVNGVQFVGISIDEVDKTREFAANFKINYPSLIGNFDTVEISRQAGNQKRALPFTVILDRKGHIAATELGGLTEQKLEATLKQLL